MNSHNNETGQQPEDRVLVIHPEISGKPDTVAFKRKLEDVLEEAAGLARAIHLTVADVRAVKIARPNPSMLFGSGAAEEIGKAAAELEVGLVIINHSLSPVQQRNLERAWEVKVIDRTGLILEIFGERAQTREGRIQVDLAALEYQKSRLVRSWTHLERQRGGAGFMGGPGETQLEIDRRIITDRIAKLKKELEKVRKTRELGRKSRERVPFPVVALVGYTNAGKSTLFNKLTGSNVFAEDLPFATLDPTMRRLGLPSGRQAILSDTVGFIADLPTHLVAAFRATLEQVQYADVILHVRDVSLADTQAQKADVIEILHDLGIDYDSDERILEVMNKIDLCLSEDRDELIRKARVDKRCHVISALSGEGLDALLGAVDSFMAQGTERCFYSIKSSDGEAIAWLYSHASVKEKREEGEGVEMLVEIDLKNKKRFEARFGYLSGMGDDEDDGHDEECCHDCH